MWTTRNGPTVETGHERPWRGVYSGSEQSPGGFVPELIDFLRTNKKWWLTPIVIVLLLVGLLIFMSGTSLAPFVYSVF